MNREKSKRIRTRAHAGGSVPALLTRRQVADRLGVHPETVKRYQKRGFLECHQIPSYVLQWKKVDKGNQHKEYHD